MTNDPWSARIDWSKVLDDIAYLLGDARTDNEHLREPVSQEKLATAIGFPRGTIRNWLEGSEPRHSDGEMLISHWCRLTGKARTFIHVDRYVYSAAKAGGVQAIRTSTNSDKPKAASYEEISAEFVLVRGDQRGICATADRATAPDDRVEQVTGLDSAT